MSSTIDLIFLVKANGYSDFTCSDDSIDNPDWLFASGTEEPVMYLSRLLLPAAMVLLPWLNTCCWAQNYSAMQRAYGGAIPEGRNQFSLPNQATRPPLFPDQQVNDYTAMSPTSWGHPATRRNPMQTRPAIGSYATPTPASVPSVSAAQDIADRRITVLDQKTTPERSTALLGSYQPTELTPLTNTGDRRHDSVLPKSKESREADRAQPSNSASQRYARAQDFPFDGPSAAELKDSGDSLFPFTRKEQVDPVTPIGELTGNRLLGGSQDSRNPSVSAVPPVSSHTLFDTRLPATATTDDSNLGLYSTPSNVSPTMQSPLVTTQPYAQQQTLPQQMPVPNNNQPALGFGYPDDSTTAVSQWNHPSPVVRPHPNAAVYQDDSQYMPNWASVVQTEQEGLPHFRPDLGHRDAMPTVRGRAIPDDGKKFDHEKKKVDYPPFKEIIATGKFFYNAEVNALRPSFLGNTGLSVDGAGFSESQPFDFSTTYAPLIKFGFESKYGPGVELSYFNLTENANTLGATNDGSGNVTSIASVAGPGRISRIGADNIGETLTADHSIDLESFGLNFFKELKFPISRLNGKFGFMYANVAQSLLVEVNDAVGASVGALTNTTDFRGYGPQFALEYFRPVGHTPLTLVTSFGGKGLFGRRDQFLSNDAGIVERRFGADEFITVIDFAGGIQLKKMVADGRYWTAKVGYLHQAWLGGGTAVDPQGDFGINGFTFGVGYNR